MPTDVLQRATQAAERAPDDAPTVLHGPITVGNIGHADVIDKPVSKRDPSKRVVCVRYNGGAAIPLAAAVAAVDDLRAQEAAQDQTSGKSAK